MPSGICEDCGSSWGHDVAPWHLPHCKNWPGPSEEPAAPAALNAEDAAAEHAARWERLVRAGEAASEAIVALCSSMNNLLKIAEREINAAVAARDEDATGTSKPKPRSFKL